jgi:hypothetical protein
MPHSRQFGRLQHIEMTQRVGIIVKMAFFRPRDKSLSFQERV